MLEKAFAITHYINANEFIFKVIICIYIFVSLK